MFVKAGLLLEVKLLMIVFSKKTSNHVPAMFSFFYWRLLTKGLSLACEMRVVDDRPKIYRSSWSSRT